MKEKLEGDKQSYNNNNYNNITTIYNTTIYKSVKYGFPFPLCFATVPLLVPHGVLLRSPFGPSKCHLVGSCQDPLLAPLKWPLLCIFKVPFWSLKVSSFGPSMYLLLVPQGIPFWSLKVSPFGPLKYPLLVPQSIPFWSLKVSPFGPSKYLLLVP